MVNRFAFLVDKPDEEDRQEFRCAGDYLTPEEAVERVYENTPDGTEIIKPLRGMIPDDLDLSAPEEHRLDSAKPDGRHEGTEPATTPVEEDETDELELDDVADEEPDERAVELADEHWKTAKSAVLDGEADDYLDELAGVDDRGSVQGAIAERRQEVSDD